MVMTQVAWELMGRQAAKSRRGPVGEDVAFRNHTAPGDSGLRS